MNNLKEDQYLSCKYISHMILNEDDEKKRNIYYYDYIYTMGQIIDKESKFKAMALLVRSLMPKKHRELFEKTITLK